MFVFWIELKDLEEAFWGKILIICSVVATLRHKWDEMSLKILFSNLVPKLFRAKYNRVP